VCNIFLMKDPLLAALSERGVVHEGRFRGTSGAEFNTYISIKWALGPQKLRYELAGRLRALMPVGTTVIAGVGVSGTVLATALCG
jgi:orotate phosphoribosyltransferase